jgi:hypothetical protein
MLFTTKALSALDGAPIDVQAALASLDRLEPHLGKKYIDEFRRLVEGTTS